MIRFEPNERFDISAKRHGVYVFKAPVARIGKHYYGPGDRGTLPAGFEHRDHDELRNIASQLSGKPVVLFHPPGLIRNGAKGKFIGEMARGWVEGDLAMAEIKINHHDGIDAIEEGIRELSLGYSTDIDANAFQRGSLVDHLALVRMSRCGAECTIRTDCSAHCSCKSMKSVKEISMFNQIIASRINHG